MQSGYVDSGGLRLYYETRGEGEPLLMLNGGPGFPHDYLEATGPLASDARLVFFDQRGTGKSDKADPKEYTVAANVADVEAVRSALGLGRCALFGHSWGGMLAQAYASKHPENVTRLILADTFSSIGDLNLSLARMREAVPAETRAVYERHERAGLYADGDRYPDEYQDALEVAYEPVNLGVPATPALEHAFAHLAYDVYRAMWGERTEFEVTGTLTAFDGLVDFARLTMPTLVIVGASDMPTVSMAEATARHLPDARLEVFEHSRHFPFLEEPDRFFAVVRRFLAEGAAHA